MQYPNLKITLKNSYRQFQIVIDGFFNSAMYNIKKLQNVVERKNGV